MRNLIRQAGTELRKLHFLDKMLSVRERLVGILECLVLCPGAPLLATWHCAHFKTGKPVRCFATQGLPRFHYWVAQTLSIQTSGLQF